MELREKIIMTISDGKIMVNSIDLADTIFEIIREEVEGMKEGECAICEKHIGEKKEDFCHVEESHCRPISVINKIIKLLGGK